MPSQNIIGTIRLPVQLDLSGVDRGIAEISRNPKYSPQIKFRATFDISGMSAINRALDSVMSGVNGVQSLLRNPLRPTVDLSGLSALKTALLELQNIQQKASQGGITTTGGQLDPPIVRKQIAEAKNQAVIEINQIKLRAVEAKAAATVEAQSIKSAAMIEAQSIKAAAAAELQAARSAAAANRNNAPKPPSRSEALSNQIVARAQAEAGTTASPSILPGGEASTQLAARLQLQLKAKLASYNKVFSAFESELNSPTSQAAVSSGLGSAGLNLGGLGGFAAIAIGQQLGQFIVGVGTKAVDLALTEAKSLMTLRSVSGGITDYNASIANSRKLAAQLGTSQLQELRSATEFKAATKGTALEFLSDDLNSGISKFAAVRGVDKDAVQRGKLGFKQIAQNGRFQAEEYNQISENIPGLGVELAAASGLTAGQLRAQSKLGTVNVGSLLSNVSARTNAVGDLESRTLSESAVGKFGRFDNAKEQLLAKSGAAIIDPLATGADLASKAINLITENLQILLSVGGAALGAIAIKAYLGSAAFKTMAASVSSLSFAGLAAVPGQLGAIGASARAALAPFAQLAVITAGIELITGAISTMGKTFDENSTPIRKMAKDFREAAEAGDDLARSMKGIKPLNKGQADKLNEKYKATNFFEQVDNAVNFGTDRLIEGAAGAIGIKRNEPDGLTRSAKAGLRLDLDAIAQREKSTERIIAQNSSAEIAKLKFAEAGAIQDKLARLKVRAASDNGIDPNASLANEKEQAKLTKQLNEVNLPIQRGKAGVEARIKDLNDFVSTNDGIPVYAKAVKNAREAIITLTAAQESYNNLLSQKSVEAAKSTLALRSSNDAYAQATASVAIESSSALSQISDSLKGSLLSGLKQTQRTEVELRAIAAQKIITVKSIAELDGQLAEKGNSIELREAQQRKLLPEDLSKSTDSQIEQAKKAGYLTDDNEQRIKLLKERKSQLQKLNEDEASKGDAKFTAIKAEARAAALYYVQSAASLYQNKQASDDATRSIEQQGFSTKIKSALAGFSSSSGAFFSSVIDQFISLGDTIAIESSRQKANFQQQLEMFNSKVNFENRQQSQTSPVGVDGQGSMSGGGSFRAASPIGGTELRQAIDYKPNVDRDQQWNAERNRRGKGPNIHWATDFGSRIGVKVGSPVTAIADGTATFEPRVPYNGRVTGRSTLTGVDGSGQEFKAVYFHLGEKAGASFREGYKTKVKAGDQLGFVSEDGKQGRNEPHLDLKIWVNGERVKDPQKYLATLDRQMGSMSKKTTSSTMPAQASSKFSPVVGTVYFPGKGDPKMEGPEIDIYNKKITENSLVIATRTTATQGGIPYNSNAQVRNPKNGKVVNVRVVDRGPLQKGVDIDITPAVAKAIGLVPDGLNKVEISVEGNKKYELGTGVGRYKVNGNKVTYVGPIGKTIGGGGIRQGGLAQALVQNLMPPSTKYDVTPDLREKGQESAIADYEAQKRNSQNIIDNNNKSAAALRLQVANKFKADLLKAQISEFNGRVARENSQLTQDRTNEDLSDGLGNPTKFREKIKSRKSIERRFTDETKRANDDETLNNIERKGAREALKGLREIDKSTLSEEQLQYLPEAIKVGERTLKQLDQRAKQIAKYRSAVAKIYTAQIKDLNRKGREENAVDLTALESDLRSGQLKRLQAQLAEAELNQKLRPFDLGKGDPIAIRKEIALINLKQSKASETLKLQSDRKALDPKDPQSKVSADLIDKRVAEIKKAFTIEARTIQEQFDQSKREESTAKAERGSNFFGQRKQSDIAIKEATIKRTESQNALSPAYKDKEVVAKYSLEFDKAAEDNRRILTDLQLQGQKDRTKAQQDQTAALIAKEKERYSLALSDLEKRLSNDRALNEIAAKADILARQRAIVQSNLDVVSAGSQVASAYGNTDTSRRVQFVIEERNRRLQQADETAKNEEYKVRNPDKIKEYEELQSNTDEKFRLLKEAADVAKVLNRDQANFNLNQTAVSAALDTGRAEAARLSARGNTYDGNKLGRTLDYGQEALAQQQKRRDFDQLEKQYAGDSQRLQETRSKLGALEEQRLNSTPEAMAIIDDKIQTLKLLEAAYQGDDVALASIKAQRSEFEKLSKIKLDGLKTEINSFKGVVDDTIASSGNFIGKLFNGTSNGDDLLNVVIAPFKSVTNTLSQLLQSQLSELLNNLLGSVSESLSELLSGVTGAGGGTGGLAGSRIGSGGLGGLGDLLIGGLSSLFGLGGGGISLASGGIDAFSSLVMGFADGGKPTRSPLMDFLERGDGSDPFSAALRKERSESGEMPVLVAANIKERILSAKETKYYDELFPTGIMNFAGGGSLDGSSMPAIASRNMTTPVKQSGSSLKLEYTKIGERDYVDREHLDSQFAQMKSEMYDQTRKAIERNKEAEDDAWTHSIASRGKIQYG